MYIFTLGFKGSSGLCKFFVVEKTVRLSRITQMAAKPTLEGRERTWLELGAVFSWFLKFYEKVAEMPDERH